MEIICFVAAFLILVNVVLTAWRARQFKLKMLFIVSMLTATMAASVAMFFSYRPH